MNTKDLEQMEALFENFYGLGYITGPREKSKNFGKTFVLSKLSDMVIDPSSSDEYLRSPDTMGRYYILYVDLIGLDMGGLYRKNTIAMAYPSFINKFVGETIDLFKISGSAINFINNAKVFTHLTCTFRAIEFRPLKAKDQLFVNTTEEWNKFLEEIGVTKVDMSPNTSEKKFGGFF